MLKERLARVRWLRHLYRRTALVRRPFRYTYPLRKWVGTRLARLGLCLLRPDDRTQFSQDHPAPGAGEEFGKRLLGQLKGLPLRQAVELRASLEQTGRLDYEPREIVLSVGSNWERMRLRSVAKEPWTVEWIEQVVRPGDTFFDIGANVGAYSLLAAKWAEGKVRVFAFEPGFATFASLCRNVVLNNCQETIVPFPVALSDTTGMAAFNYRDINAGAALHAMGERAPGLHGECTAAYRQPMMTYRLDDFVTQFGLPVPSHIKLDVDGCELAVLRGARRVLADPRLRTVMMEIEKTGGDALVGELASSGLRLVRRCERGDAKAEQATVWYGVFAREGAGPG